MPSASTLAVNHHQSLDGQHNHQVASQQDLSDYMKGTSQGQKRSRNRNRTRNRRSPKKGKKMLPSRVARLLGSRKNGVVQIGKTLFCSTGKNREVGTLARGDGNTPDVASLCNISANSDLRTFASTTVSSCDKKCGRELFVNTDIPKKALNEFSTSCKSLSSTSCSTENTAKSSTSCDIRTRCVAIDCEMVGTGEKGSRSALGRCSIVNYEGNVVYDKYVKPDAPITDYRTPWSGIAEEHMTNAVPFYQAKQEISEILKDKIVIGHDLRNDFSVLQLRPPQGEVRDTSSYRGLRYMAGVDGKKRSVGLKAMTTRLLGKQIQKGPHCSVEDARAAMSLYRLVDGTWEEDANSLYPDRQFKSSFLDDHFWPDDL